jgi:hypothetical protein
VVLVIAVAYWAKVGFGGSGGGMRVKGSVQTLRARLKAHAVRDGTPVRSAWAAFKEFAATRVAARDITGDAEGDGFLFQWAPAGRTFQVFFTRQYVLRNDDIQQVNLVVKFAKAPIHLKPGNGKWSFDLPGDRSKRRVEWIEEVESSQLFRAITAQGVRPLSYDTFQESAE